MEKGRLIKIGSLALAAAEFTSACSGNFPGDSILAEELSRNLTDENRRITSVVIAGNNDNYQQELINNGGVNVRIGEPSISGPIVGKIPSGLVVEPVIIFDSGNGKWGATQCENPAIQLTEPYKSISEQSKNTGKAVCYFYTEGFAKEANQ